MSILLAAPLRVLTLTLEVLVEEWLVVWPVDWDPLVMADPREMVLLCLGAVAVELWLALLVMAALALTSGTSETSGTSAAREKAARLPIQANLVSCIADLKAD